MIEVVTRRHCRGRPLPANQLAADSWDNGHDMLLTYVPEMAVRRNGHRSTAVMHTSSPIGSEDSVAGVVAP
jgi:hypothetical protein